MARDFVKTDTNFMSLGVNGLGALLDGAAVISIHAWVNLDSTDSGANDNRVLTALLSGNAAGASLMVDGTGATRRVRLGGRSASGDAFQSRSGNTYAVTLSTWHAIGGVIDIGGDTITPFGGGVADNSGAVAFPSATYTNSSGSVGDAIGANSATPSTAAQTDGRIAELAVWAGSRALTADEFAALAKGYSPLLIAPDLQVAYFPLVGRNSPEPDLVGGLTGTITGTVANADHPRVIYPRKNAVVFVPTAAPPSGGNRRRRVLMGAA